MFDNTTVTITPEMAWLCIALYSIGVIYTVLNYKKWPYDESTKKSCVYFFAFFWVFAVTYTIDADFFHYKEIVATTNEVLDYGLEQVYQHLILWLHNDYMAFRIVVWGVALFAYALTAKILNIDVKVSLALLFVIFGNVFSYARATLAFAVYFLGLSLSIESKKKINNRIAMLVIGLALMGASFFLHRSMIVLIALTPVGLIDMTKKKLYFTLVATPIIIYGIQYVLGDIIALAEMDDVISRRLDLYNDYDSGQANWKGVIGSFTYYGTYAVSLFIVSRSLLNNLKHIFIPSSVMKFTTYVLALVYISMIMLIVMGGSDIYTHRYIKMTIVPISLLMTYCYTKGLISNKEMAFILGLGIFSRYWALAKFMFL